MTQRKIIAILLALAGCATVAWGLHGLMQIGSCGGDGAPPCPSEATPYAIAVAAGLPAAILAGVVGRTAATFLIFPAVAVGALWAAWEMPAGSRTGTLLFGALFGAVSALPLALIGAGLRRRRLARRLVAEGGTAIGTVTGITDTGVTVNRNPRVVLTLQIVPEDGTAPFVGQKAVVVSRVDLPRRGQCYPVWYDRSDPTRFAVGTSVDSDASAEVRRLFEKAGAATSSAAGSVPAATAFPPATPDMAAPEAAADPLDRLAKLHSLYKVGALTYTEYEQQKAKLLGTG